MFVVAQKQCVQILVTIRREMYAALHSTHHYFEGSGLYQIHSTPSNVVVEGGMDCIGVNPQLSESTVAKNCWQRNFITTLKLRDGAYFQTIPFFVK